MVVWMLVVVPMRMEMVVTVRMLVEMGVIGAAGMRMDVAVLVIVRMARLSEELVCASARPVVPKKDPHKCRPPTGDGR